jgi:flagellar L-ring protein precursor FlgH
MVAGLLAALLQSGCVGGTRPDPDFAVTRPPPPLPVAADGAIYREGFGLRLFEDARARQVGDLLTIRLVENTNASKSASTQATKESSVDFSNPTLFGTPADLGLGGIRNLEFSADNAQEFKGSGSSAQSNRLQGSITVTVSEVLANGNLVVRGEKIIALNQGDEYVRLSGIVRQQDIRPDNTVLSTQVADARIHYGGRGTVAAASIIGLLSRFFLLAFPL